MLLLQYLAVVTLIDLLVIDKKYLNEDNYQSKDEMQAENFAKTPIDEQILADKSLSYRVYNSGGERFSASDFRVSVFHKAIGGYHPAKLRIYQDIIERYLYGAPNPQVLNMLNAKYIITQNPQNGQQAVIPNPEAYGNCWFVKHIKFVKDDVEEIQAIGSTNLRDTAIVQQSFAGKIIQPQWDSAASISLTKFDNDTMEYEANCSTPQFAVFSEVYYPDGWNAYMDGKKVDYVKANYVLRGLSIPAGKHTIKFVFEPAIYKKGLTISYIGSWFVALLVLGGLFMAWREQKNKSRSISSLISAALLLNMPVNKEPAISVVICTYNRDKFIGEALNCLAKQTLHPEQFEIIVVDNKSTDNTAAIVKKFIADHPELQYAICTGTQ